MLGNKDTKKNVKCVFWIYRNYTNRESGFVPHVTLCW